MGSNGTSRSTEQMAGMELYAKKNRRFVEDTARAIQALVESLSDAERMAMGGEPGTPYLDEKDESEVAKRFVRRDEDRRIVGFLDLYWASKGAVSACVAVRRASQGKGVAGALVRDMARWLDESPEAAALGIDRINWFAKRDNPASIRLAVANGFSERDDYVKDGEWWGGVREKGERGEKSGDMEEQPEEHYKIDHVDIVTSHLCNRHCDFCIDAFLNTSREMIDVELVERFLSMIDDYTGGKTVTVLLLGGEPTVLPKDKLVDIAEIIHSHGHKASMSTNGIRREHIIDILPYYDSVQITFDDLDKMSEWQGYEDKINAKICGDAAFTMDKLGKFKRLAKDFQRRSVSMYFTDDFCELCRDKEVWEYLDGLEWNRNGSYMYAIDDGVRFKKCIPGETNIIDEPTIPKLYPNGNYNRTWRHEELDDYLSADGKSWREE